MKKLLAIGMISVLAGCSYDPSSDQIQNQHQEILNKQAVQAVGLPNIVNFQEKRVLKQIMELRDQKISTITYIVDMNAHLHKMCDSIGYGISAAVQYTNPNKIDDRLADTTYNSNGRAQGWYVLPQADPNGLYSPATEEGTYVLCLNPIKKDEVAPVYSEPRLIVSPFPLDIK